MTNSDRIRKFYKELYGKYGPQGWWPGDSQLECAIGAILTQNTSWTNVEKAIGNLKSNGLLSVDKLSRLTGDELASMIKPAGYYNQKARNIKILIRHIVDRHGGSIGNMFKTGTAQLREELLGLRGIGPETADSMLLYAAERPVFVVDAYTYRILSRHGLVPEQTNYQEIQELFTASLEENVRVYNEYHALLVKVGKNHCRKPAPLCRGCPLAYDPHTV